MNNYTIDTVFEPKENEAKGQTFKKYIKEHGFAAAYFLTGRALDFMITSHNMHRLGTGMEANPVQKYLMNTLGIDEALALTSAAEIGVALPISYKKNKVLNIKTNTILYIMGTLHFLGAASNVPLSLSGYF
jgi:hypothetical protein